MLPQTLSILCAPPAPLQEDNHSYYVSRTYGPGDARLRGLWVDMAAANRSHVKIHGILSNTHRQASVSPTGPRLSLGSPLPAGISPRGWGAARPTGGWQQLLRFSWWRAKRGRCLGFPRALGGQKGTGDELWVLGTRSHPAPITPCTGPGRLLRGRAELAPMGTEPSRCLHPEVFHHLTAVLTPLFPPQRIILSFDFPFYGHLLRQVTIATGGEPGGGARCPHGLDAAPMRATAS